ncbi:YkoP family protein [Bacillus horti]|uniref:YkoP-like domain-containing protein n=1 Tax=Caldalkalibacillus horti TaxID=77523 RepID=A0ABT9W4D6_9BACI|nr:hypothetical protein [Bacillus horti]MDQ0168112.1 hypothetical protein [Bacillus horti]
MKAIILTFWGIWDWIYFQLNRMEYVSKADNLFRIVRKTYKGPDLQTQTGKWITKGDQILKLHLYNYRLAKELHQNPNRSLAIYLKRNIEHSLFGLSVFTQQLPEKDQIKGIIGTSLLNRGAERFGFRTYDVEKSFYFSIKHYLYKVICLLVHPDGTLFLKRHGKRLKSKHMIMSLDELTERYMLEGDFILEGDLK